MPVTTTLFFDISFPKRPAQIADYKTTKAALYDIETAFASTFTIESDLTLQKNGAVGAVDFIADDF
jgi:hypothetical protein